MKKDLYSKECPSGGSFDNINKENKLSESSYPKKFSWPTDGFWHYKLLNRHLTFYCFRPPTRRQQTTHDLTYPLNNCPILFKSESNSIFFGPLVTVQNFKNHQELWKKFLPFNVPLDYLQQKFHGLNGKELLQIVPSSLMMTPIGILKETAQSKNVHKILGESNMEMVFLLDGDI